MFAYNCIRGTILFIAAFSLPYLSTPAAANCKPLTLATSVNLVHPNGDLRPFIPVALQGLSKVMLVDTGGSSSMISSSLADQLKLPRRKLEFEVFGLKGDKSDEGVTVDDLKIGRLEGKSIDFVVTKRLAGEKGGTESSFVGIIGPSILTHYDLDIDFGADKLSLLSPDHCEGKVVYWPATAVAIVPARVLKLGHILVTARLDGQDITALLDTGAYKSALMLPAAEGDFGLKPGEPDTPKTGELVPGQSTYRHRFKSLDLNGIAVSNLDIDILPDLNATRREVQPQTGTLLPNAELKDQSPDLILGMNVLRHLHIYIAYNEQKVYVTPAGPPPEKSGATSDGSTPTESH